MASAIKTNTDYMFARIDMLNREYKGSIPYSIAVDESPSSFELFLKHDSDPEKDIELWHRPLGTQKSMQQRAAKLTAWDELRALKEIGNSYIRDLNVQAEIESMEDERLDRQLKNAGNYPVADDHEAERRAEQRAEDYANGFDQD